MQRETTRHDFEDRLIRVFTYIEAHLAQTLEPQELANIACFSPFHFHRFFRGATGESVMGYVRRLRLQRASQRLTTSRSSILDIAMDVGYTSNEAFSRAFKAHFGRSPSKFREEKMTQTFKQTENNFQDDITLQQKVNIKKYDERHVVSVRNIGPYMTVGQAWSRLCMWAAPLGLMQPGMEMLGLCHDDPEITPAEKIRYDACIVTDFAGDLPAGFTRQTIPGGQYAVMRHLGAYENLAQSYIALMGQWLPRSGKDAADNPSVEIYYNDPESTPVDELETDICILLR